MTTPDKPAGYISCDEFSLVCGLKYRASAYALSRALNGKTWRGHSLTVVAQHGRGGSSGLSYLVRLDSLPLDLRNRAEAMFGAASDDAPPVPALPAPATGTALAVATGAPLAFPLGSAGAAATARRWEWVMEIIRPALALPKGSRERAETIAELARHAFLTPNGDRRQFSVSTLRDWITRYEAKGLGGLERQGRADRGKARVMISRTWDTGVSFSDDVKTQIAQRLETYVKRVWKKAGGGKGKGSAKTGGGWNVCCRLATKELVKMTREGGLDLSDAKLLTLCDVPRSFVEQYRNYAILALKDNDAKAFFDTAAPRTRRTRVGMVPMELVVGDVHHLDIYLRRDDGSLYTPKIIAWYDIATNRLFYTLVFVAKGKGIRQEDVCRSYIEMTQHPEWGHPQALYLDNGGEYSKLGFVNDAMKLTQFAQCQNFRVAMVGDDPAVNDLVRRATSARHSMVVKAQPYNAPAKPIEGAFAVLEGGPLALIEGWVGGNRMKAKTKNVGREPTPFSGSEDEFRAQLATALDWYHTNAQTGSLKGKSPRETFAEAVNKGWMRTDIDLDTLHAVFATEDAREVMQGEFSYKNVTYRAHELLALQPGTKVTIRVPLVGDKSRIAVLDDEGRFLCIATPAPLFGFLDPEGAKDRGRRIKAQNKALRDMAAEVDDVDLVAEMGEAAALHPPAPIPESNGTIRLSAELEDIAQANRQLPASRAKARDEELDRRRAQAALLEQYARAG